MNIKEQTSTDLIFYKENPMLPDKTKIRNYFPPYELDSHGNLIMYKNDLYVKQILQPELLTHWLNSTTTTEDLNTKQCFLTRCIKSFENVNDIVDSAFLDVRGDLYHTIIFVIKDNKSNRKRLYEIEQLLTDEFETVEIYFDIRDIHHKKNVREFNIKYKAII